MARNAAAWRLAPPTSAPSTSGRARIAPALSAFTVALRIERAIRDLLPFSQGQLERRPLPTRHWDTDAWLADPPPHRGWPDDLEVRLSSRPSVYSVERSNVGALGAEGELWLGWRAGDAIAEELG